MWGVEMEKTESRRRKGRKKNQDDVGPERENSKS